MEQHYDLPYWYGAVPKSCSARHVTEWKRETNILIFYTGMGYTGVTFLCIGIDCEDGKRNICTLPVTATVVDLRRERVGVDDFSTSGEAALKSWFPIYEYTVGGVTQRAKAFIGAAKPEVEVGQAVELFVNPDHIGEFLLPD